jgi:hypothetical protein
VTIRVTVDVLPDRIARLHLAGRDQAGDTPEVEIGTVDPLHRQAEWPRARRIDVDLDRFEMVDQGRPLVPGRPIRLGGDVVAGDPGDRNGGEAGDADLGREGAIGQRDPVEHRLVVIDQVHLVDRQHDVLDADQMRQIAVAPGLGQHALARIDQDHRQVGGRGTRHHVAGILFVPRRVGDDELALRRREEAVSDIDRDALLALGGKTVDEEGEIDILALRSDPLAVRLQRGQLILEDHLAVVEEAPDQGRLAVVHRSAGDESQQRLLALLHEIGVDILGDEGIGLIFIGSAHQK